MNSPLAKLLKIYPNFYILIFCAVLSSGCGKKKQVPVVSLPREISTVEARPLPKTKTDPERLSQPNQAANALFVEASLLLSKSVEAKGDVEKEYPLVDQALVNLEKIISDYPQSDLAVTLIQGKATINEKPFSLTRAKKNHSTLRSKFLLRREAQSSPMALLLYAANQMDGKGATYRSIVNALAASGENDKALALIKEMDWSYRDHALLGVVRVMLQTGNQAEVQAVVQKLRGEEKVAAFLSMVEHSKSSGNKTNIKAHLSKAITAAEQIYDDNDQVRAFSRIALAMAREGDRPGAKEVLLKALNVARDIPGHYSTHEETRRVLQAKTAKAIRAVSLERYLSMTACTLTIKTMAITGDISGAINLARGLADGHKDDALRAVIKTLLEAGNASGAIAVAEKLETEWIALREIANALMAKGDKAGVLSIAKKNGRRA